MMGAEIPKRQKSYYYSQPFSLFEQLEGSYYGSLNEVVALLRQVAKTKEFIGLEDILLRLEQRLSVTDADKNALIQFEEVILKGKEYLPKLSQHLNKDFIRFDYKPFNEERRACHVFPIVLKEYNNRWFLIGWSHDPPKEKAHEPLIFALDRIEGEIRKTALPFPVPRPDTWLARLRDQIGLSPEGTLEEVVLRFSEQRFQYVATKQLHPSQQIIGPETLALRVYTNRELLSKILEFGADVEVLAPASLRATVHQLLQKAVAQYELPRNVLYRPFEPYE
jgi:hypothetical protein